MPPFVLADAPTTCAGGTSHLPLSAPLPLLASTPQARQPPRRAVANANSTKHLILAVPQQHHSGGGPLSPPMAPRKKYSTPYGAWTCQCCAVSGNFHNRCSCRTCGKIHNEQKTLRNCHRGGNPQHRSQPYKGKASREMQKSWLRSRSARAQAQPWRPLMLLLGLTLVAFQSSSGCPIQ